MYSELIYSSLSLSKRRESVTMRVILVLLGQFESVEVLDSYWSPRYPRLDLLILSSEGFV